MVMYFYKYKFTLQNRTKTINLQAKVERTFLGAFTIGKTRKESPISSEDINITSLEL